MPILPKNDYYCLKCDKIPDMTFIVGCPEWIDVIEIRCSRCSALIKNEEKL